MISKSIAIDLYQGKELTRFFAMLSSVQGLAPVCAPVLGGILLGAMDWKGIFWILLAIGILLIVALSAFKESLEIKKRQKGNVFSTFKYYLPVLRNRQFMRYVLIQAFAMGACSPISQHLLLFSKTTSGPHLLLTASVSVSMH